MMQLVEILTALHPYSGLIKLILYSEICDFLLQVVLTFNFVCKSERRLLFACNFHLCFLFQCEENQGMELDEADTKHYNGSNWHNIL